MNLVTSSNENNDFSNLFMTKKPTSLINATRFLTADRKNEAVHETHMLHLTIWIKLNLKPSTKNQKISTNYLIFRQKI